MARDRFRVGQPWWTELRRREEEGTTAHSGSHRGREPERFKGRSTNFGIGGTKFWTPQECVCVQIRKRTLACALTPLGERRGICPDIFVLFCLLGVCISSAVCVPVWVYTLSVCCLEGKGTNADEVSPQGQPRCSEFYLCFLITLPTTR